MTSDAELLEQVRSRYAAAALSVTAQGAPARDCGCGAGECNCAGSCCTPSGADATEAGFGHILYTPDERSDLPEEAVLASLGCGNPLAVADLDPGETVLDLGSGGGIDVLLSAKRVGPDRQGLRAGHDRRDARPRPPQRRARPARRTSSSSAAGSRRSRCRASPWTSSSPTAWSTSPPTRRRVFAEIARVLRPGGRLGISDVVADDHLTPAERRRAGQLRRLHRRRADLRRVPRGPERRRPGRRLGHPDARGRRRHARRDRPGDEAGAVRLLLRPGGSGAAQGPSIASSSTRSAASSHRSSASSFFFFFFFFSVDRVLVDQRLAAAADPAATSCPRRSTASAEGLGGPADPRRPSARRADARPGAGEGRAGTPAAPPGTPRTPPAGPGRRAGSAEVARRAPTVRIDTRSQRPGHGDGRHRVRAAVAVRRGPAVHDDAGIGAGPGDGADRLDGDERGSTGRGALRSASDGSTPRRTTLANGTDGTQRDPPSLLGLVARQAAEADRQQLRRPAGRLAAARNTAGAHAAAAGAASATEPAPAVSETKNPGSTPAPDVRRGERAAGGGAPHEPTSTRSCASCRSLPGPQSCGSSSSRTASGRHPAPQTSSIVVR